MKPPALDPPVWTFDVTLASHDDLSAGVTERLLCRVRMSREEFPSWVSASEAAACLAVSVHGGMPTRVTPVY